VRILRNKPHRLSSETERVLAAFGRTFSLPYSAYQTAKAADLVFDPVDLEDRQEPLSYVLYENDYSVTSETELRRQSFAQFSETIGQQRNPLWQPSITPRFKVRRLRLRSVALTALSTISSTASK